MADAAPATPTTEGGAPPEQPKVEPKPEAVETPAKSVEGKPAEEPKKPEPRFYERKVNGRIEKIPAEAVDAAAQALGLSPNEILSASQLKRAAYERFEQAEKTRKEVEALRGIKDPWKLAQTMAGLDDAALDAAAEQRLIAKLQREAMDPAQRQLLEEREKIAKERAALEAERAKQSEQVLTQQAAAIRERLEPLVIDAIEKAGLPKTPDAVRAVVNELERQHRFGLPLDPTQAASDAREQFFRPSVSMLKNLPAEAIVRELGKEKYAELLRYSLTQKGEKPAEKPAETPKPAAKERAWMSEKEWRQRFGGI
jgi:hypothetical protein